MYMLHPTDPAAYHPSYYQYLAQNTPYFTFVTNSRVQSAACDVLDRFAAPLFRTYGLRLPSPNYILDALRWKAGSEPTVATADLGDRQMDFWPPSTIVINRLFADQGVDEPGVISWAVSRNLYGGRRVPLLEAPLLQGFIEWFVYRGAYAASLAGSSKVKSDELVQGPDRFSVYTRD